MSLGAGEQHVPGAGLPAQVPADRLPCYSHAYRVLHQASTLHSIVLTYFYSFVCSVDCWLTFFHGVGCGGGSRQTFVVCRYEEDPAGEVSLVVKQRFHGGETYPGWVLRVSSIVFHYLWIFLV